MSVEVGLPDFIPFAALAHRVSSRRATGRMKVVRQVKTDVKTQEGIEVDTLCLLELELEL